MKFSNESNIKVLTRIVIDLKQKLLNNNVPIEEINQIFLNSTNELIFQEYNVNKTPIFNLTLVSN